jgi:outer membrane protein assembly factor BamA
VYNQHGESQPVFIIHWSRASHFVRTALSVTLCAIVIQVFPSETFGASFPHDVDQAVRDTSLEGVIIDSISVEARNIFDTKTAQYDRWMFRMANKFHLTTKSRIIGAELLFAVGEPFSWELAYETERNLRNRLSLYDALVTPSRLSDGRLLVEVITIDVWSLSGGVNITREGGETDYDVTVKDRNLFGLNQFLSFHYTDLASEKAFVSGTFHDNRLGGHPVLLQASMSNSDLNNYITVGIARPYYSLSDRASGSLFVSKEGGRFDQYDDTVLLGQNHFDGSRFLIGGSYRFGNRVRKLTASAKYGYTDERTTNTTIFAATHADSQDVLSSLPRDSSFHSINFGMSLSNERYRELRRIDRFTKIEDIPVGLYMVTQAGKARTRSMNLYDLFLGGVSYTLHHPGGVVYVSAESQWWSTDQVQLRRKTAASFRWYYYRPSFVTFALHGTHREDDVQTAGDPLVLGGKSGLRGYDTRFLTGHRVMVLGAESRFFPGLEILSAPIGGVFFVDAGRVWQKEEPFRFRDFYLSAGIGLRIAPERVSSGRPIRIDLAYSKKVGWSLSISTGQYFSLLSDNFLLTSR